jgi:endonuclease YncB( thermonuclease family)
MATKFHGSTKGPRAAWRLGLAIVVASSCSARAAQEPTRAGACPTAGPQTGVIQRIDGNLDILLRDGRSLHLAGLDPVEATPDHPDFPDQARHDLSGKIPGGSVTFLPLAAAPDRWGRIPALVFFPPQAAGTSSVSVAIFLLSHGLARFMPVPEIHACRSDFLAAEAAARKMKRGLWQDAYYAVLSPSDRAAFAERAASNVIVEGRLAAVTSNRYRTTLGFEPKNTHGLTVTIVKRNVAKFDRSGLDFHALIGHRLRVRGLLDLRFGPHIEPSSADAIEIMPDEPEKGSLAASRDPIAEPPPAHRP